MNSKKYSTVYYWRYIFTPLLLLTLAIGLFILFTTSDIQNLSYDKIQGQIITQLTQTQRQINSS